MFTLFGMTIPITLLSSNVEMHAIPGAPNMNPLYGLKWILFPRKSRNYFFYSPNSVATLRGSYGNS
jgi:hypothetical protein